MAFMTTIVLLTISNIFMTFAWYGHLKYRQAPLFKGILASWLIAFAEYCLQVPANRLGSYEFSPVQLKTIQEVNHSGGIFWLLGLVPGRWFEMELFCRLWLNGDGGLGDFQEVVRRSRRSIRGPLVALGTALQIELGCFLNRNLRRAIFRLR
jgi:uncharacterized protein (DUF486 family)